MQLDLKHYINSLPTIESILIVNPNTPSEELVSLCSFASHCHVIVVSYYIASIRGMTPELERKINFLKDFYGCDSVLGIEDLKIVRIDQQSNKNSDSF